MIEIILPPYSFLNIKDDWVTKNFLLRWYAKKKYRKIIELGNDAKVVLDAGCGAGYFTCNIASHYKNVVVIDIDYDIEINGHPGKKGESILFMAKKLAEYYKLTNVEFLQRDLKNTEIDSNYFEIIFCLEALEHVDEQDNVLSELKRILKPGGSIILSIPNVQGINILWRRIGIFFFRLPVDFEDEAINNQEFINILKNYFIIDHQEYFPFNLKYFSNSVIFKATKNK